MVERAIYILYIYVHMYVYIFIHTYIIHPTIYIYIYIYIDNIYEWLHTCSKVHGFIPQTQHVNSGIVWQPTLPTRLPCKVLALGFPRPSSASGGESDYS
jgi:hypothetical protein